MNAKIFLQVEKDSAWCCSTFDDVIRSNGLAKKYYSVRENPNMLDKILEEYRRIWALNYASSLLGWDLETYMPEDDSQLRGEAIANISTVMRELTLSLADKLDKVRDEDLDDFGRGVVRVLRRSVRFYRAVPREITEELDRLASQSAVVWREARRRSDFKSFEPYLRRIVELEKEVADRLGYEGHPYDALVDLYEEGMTVSELDSLFNVLVPGLKKLLDRVIEDEYFPPTHPLEEQEYERSYMEKVNGELLKLLDIPQGSFRMDVSAHPFTVRISSKDVRITTRYEGRDFRATMFSVIHESGHALYELMIDPVYEMTPVGSGVSTGVHESQSRFWENVVGRSREFVRVVYPILKERLPFLRDYSEESVYKYFNVVRPSLIRVDSDELTYNFHIALRYEVEKGLIGGKLEVSELPTVWEDFMDKYLGVRPKNHAEGVLQDIHWSQGSFGYFPTYTLGNVISATLWSKLDGFSQKVEEWRVEEIKNFLRERVCKYGALYPPKLLLNKTLGEAYNPERLIQYLSHKFIDRD